MTRWLAETEYTLSIPLIEGSQEGMEQIANHNVCVVTARQPKAEEATKQWLNTHFPCLTEYFHAGTGTKHTLPADILIDDLDMNIVEFVKSASNRRGILFMQPWSINGVDIRNYSDQVHYCPDWKSVVRAIHDIDSTEAF